MMYDNPGKTQVRKTITLVLDVVLTDEDNEDYFEAEITHPKLSGGLYVTGSTRRELEDVFDKIDLAKDEDEEEVPAYKTSTSSSSSTIYPYNTSNPSSQTASPRPSEAPTSAPKGFSVQLPVPNSANAVEALIKNTFNAASGIMEMRARLKKK